MTFYIIIKKESVVLYCTIYHTKGCLDQGCSDKEILEACGVSAAFAGGAAMSQAVTLVQECLIELKNQKH